MTTDSFSFTGSVQNWVCPPGITSAIIDAVGAGGGLASLGTAIPGKGGRTRCRVNGLTPGATYKVYVGGKGGNASGITGGASGSNSGRTAFGGAGANYAGGGGGSTDFRTGTNENDRIVVAPGGGGAGAKGTITPGDGGNGGDGGNPGTDGANGTPSGAGAGGLKASGGAGGTGGYYSGAAGGPAGSSGGYGGNGASFMGPGAAGGGGGGGGGYAGGGGGGTNTSGPQITGGGGGGGGSALSTGIESLIQPGVNAGDGWLTITYGPAEHCTVFEGIITDVTDSANVQLSVASSAFPDPLADYKIVFFGNTTGNPTPGGTALSAGPWTIGAMATGQAIHYYVYRPDGAHIDGSAVMRATDTAFGLYWDLTVDCGVQSSSGWHIGSLRFGSTAVAGTAFTGWT